MSRAEVKNILEDVSLTQTVEIDSLKGWYGSAKSKQEIEHEGMFSGFSTFPFQGFIEKHVCLLSNVQKSKSGIFPSFPIGDSATTID